MFVRRKMRVGKRSVEGLVVSLSGKNLVLVRGRKGYVMCGYLNLSAAGRFGDAAAKVVGVSTLRGALRAEVHSCTGAARALGIYRGQPVTEALKIIA